MKMTLAQKVRMTIVAILLGAYPLNLAVYSGASLGDLLWRFEHGRMLLEYRENMNPQSFYIAPNSEPLRFSLEWHWSGSSQWQANIPIWIPLALFLLWLAWDFYGSRR